MGNKFSVVSVMMEGSREAHLKTICVSQQVTLLPLLFMFTLLYNELLNMSYSFCAFLVFHFALKAYKVFPQQRFSFIPDTNITTMLFKNNVKLDPVGSTVRYEMMKPCTGSV